MTDAELMEQANRELAVREAELEARIRSRRLSLDADIFKPSTAAKADGQALQLDADIFKPSRATVPPVDQSVLDPRDALARRAPAPREPGADMSVFEKLHRSSPVSRLLERGGGRAALGVGQALGRHTPWSKQMEALREDEQRRWDESRQWYEKQVSGPYSQTKRTFPASGPDFPALAGEAATYTAAMPQRLPFASRAPQTMLGRAALGGEGAAVAGAATGIDNPPEGVEFWMEKARRAAASGLLGFGASLGLEAGARVVGGAANLLSNLYRSHRTTPEVIDAAVSRVISESGVDFANVSASVKAQLRADVQRILETGGTVDPKQLGRLADIRAVGAQPTRGAVTLDPVDVTQTKNLAKIGANSRDPNMQVLAQVENANNAALIERANQMGAGGAPQAIDTGNRLINALKKFDVFKQKRVSDLYEAAKDTARRSDTAIEFDAEDLVTRVNANLRRSMKTRFLPAEVQGTLDDLVRMQKETGRPMSLEDFQTLQTMMASSSRSAKDGNAQMAIKVARDALEETPPIASGESAIQAFNRARRAHRARMQLIEDTPALKAVIEGVEPDKFVEVFLLSRGGKANVAEVAALKKAITADPEAFDMTRRTVIDYLKREALNKASDEVGVFSASGFNRAMDRLGDQKLRLFFGEGEIAQLKQLGRAADYLIRQVKGSAVNNSNSGALLAAKLDDVLEKIARSSNLGPVQSVAAARPFSARNNVALAAETLDPVSAMLADPLNLGPYGSALGTPTGVMLPQYLQDRHKDRNQ